ncbi:MAG TPA: cytochrome c oxidase subunit 3 [Bryobacteraceae bacterium]|nr:cytochrome c oxidase subunit 3 [Bryobacteraceae bacterium]HZP32351.1 cytochrome c oxidase subunit 3 [Candidatus Acidoferrales bacterium]
MSEAAAGSNAIARPAPHPASPALHHQFEDLEQQYEASSMGMWVFLATEILFFGGLFTSYIIYRSLYYPGFAAGSHGLNGFFGAMMTFILLTSSFTMAMSVHAARHGKRLLLILLLIATIVLGIAFLALKFTEYGQKWHEAMVPGFNFHPAAEALRGAPPRSVELFMCFYFFMTGLHALHMIVGISLLSVMTILAWRGRIRTDNYDKIEVSGLYWHFVDVIWIYLFPLLYLIGGRYS